VSFKHKGFMYGSNRPKEPSLYRLRSDMTWQNVVDNFKQKTPKGAAFPLKFPKKRTRGKGQWREPANVVSFFVRFAEQLGFDPLIAENWYAVTFDQLKKKGAKPFLQYYPSYKMAIAKAFPHLDFAEEWLKAKKARTTRGNS